MRCNCSKASGARCSRCAKDMICAGRWGLSWGHGFWRFFDTKQTILKLYPFPKQWILGICLCDFSDIFWCLSLAYYTLLPSLYGPPVKQPKASKFDRNRWARASNTSKHRPIFVGGPPQRQVSEDFRVGPKTPAII